MSIQSNHYQNFADKFKNEGDMISMGTYCQKLEEYRQSLLPRGKIGFMPLLDKVFDVEIRDSYRIATDLTPDVKRLLDNIQEVSLGALGAALVIAFIATVIVMGYNAAHGTSLFTMNRFSLEMYLIAATTATIGIVGIAISNAIKYFYSKLKINKNALQELIKKADENYRPSKVLMQHQELKAIKSKP